MARQEIESKLKEIIRDIDEDADVENLDYSSPLKDQLDLDSMDALDIIMEMRKSYKIGIPEEDYVNFETMNGCIDYISGRI